MKLIFLYGPPAVGKFTVGGELSKRTGFKLFHNHVTVDVARILYDIDTNFEDHEKAAPLKDQLRLDVIAAAARDDINLIFTLAYTRGVSDEFVRQVVKIVTDYRGSVCFVQLHASMSVLHARIGGGLRAEMRKPTDPAHLDEKFARGGLDMPVLFTNNLYINTDMVQPQVAAERIIRQFHL